MPGKQSAVERSFQISNFRFCGQQVKKITPRDTPAARPVAWESWEMLGVFENKYSRMTGYLLSTLS